MAALSSSSRPRSSAACTFFRLAHPRERLRLLTVELHGDRFRRCRTDSASAAGITARRFPAVRWNQASISCAQPDDRRISGVHTQVQRHAACCLGRCGVADVVFETAHEQREHPGVVEYLSMLGQGQTILQQLGDLAEPLLPDTHQLSRVGVWVVTAQLLNGDVERLDRRLVDRGRTHALK